MGALPFVLFSSLFQGLTSSAVGNVALFVSLCAQLEKRAKRNDKA